MLLWVYKHLFQIPLSVIGISPEVELLGHMAIVFLTFLRNHHAFSTGAIPLSIPINSTREFRCLLILTNTCYFAYLSIYLGFPEVQW